MLKRHFEVYACKHDDLDVELNLYEFFFGSLAHEANESRSNHMTNACIMCVDI